MSGTRAPRTGGRLGGGVALVVCLAVAITLAVLAPGPGDLRRHVIDVEIGERAVVPEYDVTVTGVTLGTSIADAYGTIRRSEVTYVRVEATTSVYKGPQTLSNVWLATRDGHRYDPRDEFTTAAPPVTQSGFSCRFSLVFELPQQRVPGAVLVFDGPSGTFDVYRDAVRVDLALRGDTAVRTEPLTVRKATDWVTR